MTKDFDKEGRNGLPPSWLRVLTQQHWLNSLKEGSYYGVMSPVIAVVDESKLTTHQDVVESGLGPLFTETTGRISYISTDVT